MSLLRPAARVTDPEGRTWELYLFRLQLPPPRRPVHGWLRELAAEAARARRSDEWFVEAVVWLPHETRYRWTTSGEFRRNVLAQLEGQLARGEVPPRPTRATYLGAKG
ncbi:MAG TPA: hypothetical protein VHD91_03250 [Gaiellaceae bacterium]|nr:hypothetical protein [Gaiellaceae bacterium]